MMAFCIPLHANGAQAATMRWPSNELASPLSTAVGLQGRPKCPLVGGKRTLGPVGKRKSPNCHRPRNLTVSSYRRSYAQGRRGRRKQGFRGYSTPLGPSTAVADGPRLLICPLVRTKTDSPPVDGHRRPKISRSWPLPFDAAARSLVAAQHRPTQQRRIAQSCFPVRVAVLEPAPRPPRSLTRRLTHVRARDMGRDRGETTSGLA